MNQGTGWRARRWNWVVTAALALGSVVPSGCESDGNPLVMSLKPFYTPVDVEADSRLEGRWSDRDGEVTFVFLAAGEHGKESAYKLTVKEREGEREASGEFDVHIVRLGSFRFLDIYPQSNTVGGEFYRTHFIRAHTMARVEIRQDSVEMAFLSATWLAAQLKDKSVETPYVKADDSLVLTAKTEDLQELLFRYANDDQAFPDPLTLERRRLGEDEQ
jgi:hypothetical protein